MWFVALLFVMVPVQSLIPNKNELQRNASRRLYQASGSDELEITSSRKAAFDAAVMNRYACKKFKRFDENYADEPASQRIHPQAMHCLELAR
jgi:hypothetical protein